MDHPITIQDVISIIIMTVWIKSDRTASSRMETETTAG